jgi:hypothetical protein
MGEVGRLVQEKTPQTIEANVCRATRNRARPSSAPVSAIGRDYGISTGRVKSTEAMFATNGSLKALTARWSG